MLQVALRLAAFIIPEHKAFSDPTYYAGEAVIGYSELLNWTWALLIFLWLLHGFSTFVASYRHLSRVDYNYMRTTQVSCQAASHRALRGARTERGTH